MTGRFPLRIRRRLAGARRDDHGAAVVEFALVVPVLFLIIFAVIDFGRALWTMNVLSSGVREGARAAAVQSSTTAALDTARARTSTYINGIIGSTLATGDINATYDAATGHIRVQITGGFPFTPITPFAGRFFPSSFRFQPDASYRWELAN